MPTIWGPVTEVSDLGVVAEQCPHCEQVTPCLLRSVTRGNYVLFIKTAAPIQESSCLCTACLRPFPCEQWRYTGVVPIQEAKALSTDQLLARTNPGLVERIQWKEQITSLGGDARFATAYEQLESMRPGALRSKLLQQVLDWGRLTEEQRAALAGEISTRARAWQFARQVAPAFPGQAGCLPAAAAALVVWSALLLPDVRTWLWGSLVVVAGLMAAALTNQVLLTQRVRHWAQKVLVPEAEYANVSLDCFLAVVDDLPGSRLGMMEDLWPVKDQLGTIRAALGNEGKL